MDEGFKILPISSLHHYLLSSTGFESVPVLHMDRTFIDIFILSTVFYQPHRCVSGC